MNVNGLPGSCAAVENIRAGNLHQLGLYPPSTLVVHLRLNRRNFFIGDPSGCLSADALLAALQLLEIPVACPFDAILFMGGRGDLRELCRLLPATDAARIEDLRLQDLLSLAGFTASFCGYFDCLLYDLRNSCVLRGGLAVPGDYGTFVRHRQPSWTHELPGVDLDEAVFAFTRQFLCWL